MSKGLGRDHITADGGFVNIPSDMILCKQQRIATSPIDKRFTVNTCICVLSIPFASFRTLFKDSDLVGIYLSVL